ncbi:ureidoglycolate dehydrogenase [Entomomonas moraniae]|uniref:Ureidoglycolate dehydrogenase n=1 Tax=Entomomonas moraniae TaxID=2213226 RepID=A0A3S9XG91_9GAMM|nr:ureidoglycolate dehydrogenase [Entomomonas moraniae]AZS51449.1 ureidoglycolate dehydrogenase [Entomomonas moraniae]
MNLSKAELHTLISNKLQLAGLHKKDADVMSDVLVFAEGRGIHSHGSVRVEYYSERISKGGITVDYKLDVNKTGPCSLVIDGDNGPGMPIAKIGMEKAIEMAKESGVAVVGVRRISHSGAISYFTQMAAKEGLIGISLCQSDPMVVPFGGAEVYYGTNPIAFSAPGKGKDDMITFDMATTVQAWGKILDKRSHKEPIPDTWAVDENGAATTDPFAVRALLPIAGPKGYGLMMMVDILSGVLLGVPFGKSVSSMYADLSKGRDLGHLHIVINPAFFGDKEKFLEAISQTMAELNAIKPAPGFKQVLYPGQNSGIEEGRTDKEGVDIVDDIYDYLVSDKIYINSYDHKNPFAK